MLFLFIYGLKHTFLQGVVLYVDEYLYNVSIYLSPIFRQFVSYSGGTCSWILFCRVVSVLESQASLLRFGFPCRLFSPVRSLVHVL